MMRRLRPDRNPLRRTADRVEAAVMAGLLVMFLAGVPLAALAAAGPPRGMRAERAQARWHRVPAVLLQDAPEPAHALSRASLEPLVRARWTAPGRAPREGEVYAPGGARAGDDRHGVDRPVGQAGRSPGPARGRDRTGGVSGPGGRCCRGRRSG